MQGASQGPFRADLLFQDGQPAPGGHVTYSIRVRGADGEHVVHRRYNDFLLLRQDLVDELETELPELPEKSTFRKRFFFTGPRFMEKREKGLRVVLKAAVAADGWAECPCLRAFLGLQVDGHRSLLGWDDGHLSRSLGPLTEDQVTSMKLRDRQASFKTIETTTTSTSPGTEATERGSPNFAGLHACSMSSSRDSLGL